MISSNLNLVNGVGEPYETPSLETLTKEYYHAATIDVEKGAVQKPHENNNRVIALMPETDPP